MYIYIYIHVYTRNVCIYIYIYIYIYMYTPKLWPLPVLGRSGRAPGPPAGQPARRYVHA